jgi:D-alanyl-D-alanine carboxypeptidase
MKSHLFKKIVSCKHYQTEVKNDTTKTNRTVIWENTNKLLRRDGFMGLKTGITVTAGPCLASAYSFK